MEEHDQLLDDEIRAQYFGAGLLVLVVTLVAGLFLWYLVYRPVRELTQGTEQIIKGELGRHIPARTGDEIGALAQSFNVMTDQLRKARDEVLTWTETLEERVDEKTIELRKAQQHLILVEKMASLGKLSATVAHELNNPLEGILTYAKLLKKRIASGNITVDQAHEIQTELSLIADESARCGNIVKNLLLFSRNRSGKPITDNLHGIIKRTIQLIEHHLKMNNISLVLELDDDPISIECLPQEIDQALFALQINAVEAMPEGGTLTIGAHLHPDNETVQIIVTVQRCHRICSRKGTAPWQCHHRTVGVFSLWTMSSSFGTH
jgi:two-component system NtrC family sensor kinase